MIFEFCNQKKKVRNDKFELKILLNRYYIYFLIFNIFSFNFIFFKTYIYILIL